MTTTATKTSRDAHRDAVNLYNEVVTLASKDYPALTEENRDAYALLPELIAACEVSYFEIDEPSRPLHFLIS